MSALHGMAWATSLQQEVHEYIYVYICVSHGAFFYFMFLAFWYICFRQGCRVMHTVVLLVYSYVVTRLVLVVFVIYLLFLLEARLQSYLQQ